MPFHDLFVRYLVFTLHHALQEKQREEEDRSISLPNTLIPNLDRVTTVDCDRLTV
jgi:hypothetical protein